MPSTTSYGLEAETTGAAAAAATKAPSVLAALDAFLGRGVIRPFRRDSKGDFANATGKALVSAAVGQVLGTRAAGGSLQGELPWRTNFGSRLYLVKHRKNKRTIEELARALIQEALGTWNPRVRIITVEPVERATTGIEARIVALRVVFDLIDENVPGNQVILSDVEVEVPLAA